MAARGADAALGSAAPPRKLLKLCSPAGNAVNHNEDLCRMLLEMGNIERSKGQIHKYKVYRVAVDSLRTLTRRVTSGADARSLPGIGQKIAKKIDEILASGNLHQLDDAAGDPVMEARRLFTKISGVGPAAAGKYVDAGYRTLDDLRANGVVDAMPHHPKLGVRYYHDFLLKIPYDEVAEIGRQACETIVSSVDRSLQFTVCGSHRRGVPMSGDIDCLLTHPLSSSDSGEGYLYLQRAGEALRRSGLLIDTLSEGPTKLMGVCRARGAAATTPARRIDIRWVAHDSFPPALLYFTGSSVFNTQMRIIALKEGYTLNEYGLFKGGEATGGGAAVAAKAASGSPSKATAGKSVALTCEKDVFDVLGIEYCGPPNRCM